MSGPGEYKYNGEHIFIRTTSTEPYQAFVSKYSNPNGSDKWFDVSHSFDSAGTWGRHGWELVAIKNKDDTNRHGFYVNSKKASVYITILSFDQIDVVTVLAPQ